MALALASKGLCALTARDVLRPDHDVVRADGTEDDSASGILDGAGDRLVHPAVAWRQPA